LLSRNVLAAIFKGDIERIIGWQPALPNDSVAADAVVRTQLAP
jgi:hypothetical protein